MKENNFRKDLLEILTNIFNSSFPDIKNTTNNFFFYHPNLTYKQKAKLRNFTSSIIRQILLLENVIKKFNKKKIKKTIKIILYIGTYELLFTEAPIHAIINENVKLTKTKFLKFSTKFVNAVLRKISQNKKSIILENKKNHFLPNWIKNNIDESNFSFEKNFCILESITSSPHYYFRINLSKNIDPKILINNLENQNVLCTETKLKGCLKINKINCDIKNILEIKNGNIYIQDITSQLCSFFIKKDIKENFKILDLCCAPGLKIVSYLSNIANYDLTAIDINFNRLKLTNKNLSKLLEHKNVTLLQNDLKNICFKNLNKFNIICVDAPCSGSGVISRYPENFLYKNKNIHDLKKTQLEILNKIVQNTKKGTIIFYSVCSFLKKETFDIIKEIEINYKNNIETIKLDEPILKINNLKYISDKSGTLIFPESKKSDGFFIAKFLKK